MANYALRGPGLLLTLGLLVGAGASLVAQGADAPPPIQGTVVDAATQQVIAGARLTVLAGGVDRATTSSDVDGVFPSARRRGGDVSGLG